MSEISEISDLWGKLNKAEEMVRVMRKIKMHTKEGRKEKKCTIVYLEWQISSLKREIKKAENKKKKEDRKQRAELEIKRIQSITRE